VDGYLAVSERRQLGWIVVHQNDVVSEIGKASACHQANISRTHYRDPHVKILQMDCAETALVLVASAKKLGEIWKMAWESSSLSPQNCNDSNSIQTSIGSTEKAVSLWCRCIFSANSERQGGFFQGEYAPKRKKNPNGLLTVPAY
jgi:hypothetical protein